MCALWVLVSLAAEVSLEAALVRKCLSQPNSCLPVSCLALQRLCLCRVPAAAGAL